MAWTILFFAGLLEIGWAIGLKYTDGFSKLVPTVLTVSCMIGSVVLLAILGIYLFNEPASAIRLVCIGFIVCGIAGLKAVT